MGNELGELFLPETEVRYDQVIADAMSRATLPLVRLTPLEELHQREAARLEVTPSYENV